MEMNEHLEHLAQMEIDANRWRAMRQTLVAADFSPEMGGGPVVMFSCHAKCVGFGPEGADAIADAAVAAMSGALNQPPERGITKIMG